MKKNFIITLITLLFVGCIQIAFAQTYTMLVGTINTCSGTILDPGGAGDYSNSTDATQTICSTTGESIQLSFTSFGTEACCDNLMLYDGNSTAAPIIGIYAGTTVPGPISTTAASNGCMTLAFRSDGSIVGAGFSANISCIASPPMNTFTMSAGTINTCSGTILDPGGAGDYSNSMDATQTICSTTGERIQLSFTSFGTEACCDNLMLYDGNSTAAPIIGIYAGTTVPGPISTTAASNGCMTLAFHSDGSIVGAGFSANISCIASPPMNTFTMSAGTINTCSGMIFDPGGAGDYNANTDVTQTICSTTGERIQLSFISFGTEACCDNLMLYDGNSTAAPIIGIYAGTTVPGPISTTAASNGCMTLAFHSDGSIVGAGFKANISCIAIPPIITLGQGGSTIVSCGDILTDPGADANYPDNANVTQTICSGVPNQCVTLSFTSFNTEATFDRLSIYDGANTTADLLGVFSGFTVPQPVSSTTNSTGCLTLVFNTNGSVNNSGFQANLSCYECQAPTITPTGFCEDAMPFCTEVSGGITFPASTGTTSQFGAPGAVGCLFLTPNPAWYFMKVDQTGALNININSGFDVDFICWGPFTQSEWEAGICTNVLDIAWADNSANIIDCSYSGSASEVCAIPDAQSGEYYAMLLINYSGQATNITFAKDITSAGTTDCSFFCNVSSISVPTICDPTTNTYNLAGTIDLTNPPSSGLLTITNSSGGYLTFNAPFASSVNYNFTNLPSNGNNEELTVVFSDDNTCAAIENYIAPATCSTCPVNASFSGPACAGQNITLVASNVSNGTYQWSGPNGFISSSQNPTIIEVTPAMSGVYQVNVFNPINGCSSSASLNLTITPNPSVSFSPSNTTFCNNSDSVDLIGGIPLGGVYSGAGVNNESFNPASAGSGSHPITYTYTDINGCSNLSSMVFEVVGCTGLEMVVQPVFEVRPNPMESSTLVSLKNYVGQDPHFNILLMDATGRKVFEKQISAEVIREGYLLNIPELASGTYMLMLNNSHYTAVKRLVK